MDIINTSYWVCQYMAVLLGYLLMEFAWPHVVFSKYLRGKSPIYRFGFCITVQTLLANTVVLCLGLLHILNAWTVRIVFYGPVLYVLYRKITEVTEKQGAMLRALPSGIPKRMLSYLVRVARDRIAKFWRTIRPYWIEYLLLGIISVSALLYLSWGSFQTTSYGYGDQYVHHAWLYQLEQGKIFPEGIYPEAMHCLIYAIHTLFGVEIYSLILFLGSIQGVIILLASYCLFRELFHWRYTPLLISAAFFLLRTGTAKELEGVARMQWTLPMEFGMGPQMICVLFLIRYLRRGKKSEREGRFSQFILGEDLFLFSMALATMIASHFYPVILSLFVCLAVALLYMRKIFSRERFVPLAAAVLCSLLIAGGPMLGAWASGMEFQGSIEWAVDIVRGTDELSRMSSDSSHTSAAPARLPGDSAHVSYSFKRLSGGGAGHSSPKRLSDNTSQAADTPERLQPVGMLGRIYPIVRRGYRELMGFQQGIFFLLLTAVFLSVYLALWLCTYYLSGRAWTKKADQLLHLCDGYFVITLGSLLIVLLYILPYLGFPELVAGKRIASTARILFFGLAAIPLDLLVSRLLPRLKAPARRALPIACFAALLLWGTRAENYRGYLYQELTRYRSEVAVMNNIIQNYQPFTYTIVSPTDGLYHVNSTGRHEELLDFLEQASGENYYIPTKHVFIFVEKRPLSYAQDNFFEGPDWLALQRYVRPGSVQSPGIRRSEVSWEESQKDPGSFSTPFKYYKDWESRTIIESKAYYWCQRFAQLYPNETHIYYEDDNFVCYYFDQEINSPYNLSIDYETK